MSALRWTLLGIGILVVLGIYLFERARRARSGLRELAGNDPGGDDELLHRIGADRSYQGGEELDSAIRELNGMIGDRFGHEPLDDTDLSSIIAERDGGSVEMDVDPERFKIKEKQSRIYQVEPSPVARGEELIIVLNVMAEPGQVFSGMELRQALDEVDLVFGDMQIYHHFGVGESQTTTPVFSVANILEPGIFDHSRIDELSIPGLCLFMRLPGPLDGRVSFELMLNTGRRLAERLDGELRDDTRSVVTVQTIGHLREKITDLYRKRMLGKEREGV